MSGDGILETTHTVIIIKAWRFTEGNRVMRLRLREQNPLQLLA
jgi:hypothetical protein